MKDKIVVWEKDMIDNNDLDWTKLEELGEVEYFDTTDADQAKKASKDASVIIINKIKIDSDFLDDYPDLKLVLIAATGYDNIDLEACEQYGVAVQNVAGYSTESVAQHVFAMLLTYVQRVNHYNEEVHAGRWVEEDAFTFSDHTIRALNDMTLGIWGYGNIGSRVGSIAKAFGLNVKASHRHPIEDKAVENISLEELFKVCDILTLHVPLTDETKRRVNKDLLEKCKNDVILINAARGGIIDEADLAGFLTENPKSVALLDVLSQEPPERNNPLLELENVVITPHQAWTNIYARKKLLAGLVENLKDYQRGETDSFLVG